MKEEDLVFRDYSPEDYHILRSGYWTHVGDYWLSYYFVSEINA